MHDPFRRRINRRHQVLHYLFSKIVTVRAAQPARIDTTFQALLTTSFATHMNILLRLSYTMQLLKNTELVLIDFCDSLEPRWGIRLIGLMFGNNKQECHLGCLLPGDTP